MKNNFSLLSIRDTETQHESRATPPRMSMRFRDNFMAEALKWAKIAFEKNEVPVGAVIVENGKIIASAHNYNITIDSCILTIL